MSVSEKVLIALLIIGTASISIATIQRDRAVRERDEARADTKVMAALYNGVLIGRGCGVPE